MTTPRRPLSLPSVTLLLAIGALLATGSCGVPLPTDETPDPRQSLVRENPDWVTIEVHADGRVAVDGEAVAMEDVSIVLANRAESAIEPLVTRLSAGGDVPYRYMDAIQREMIEGGATRVVFRVVDAAGNSDDERGIVLPETLEEAAVSQRNVLKFEVRPDGSIDVRRGEAVQVWQRLRARDIEALWRQEVADNPRLIASITYHPDVAYTQVMDVLDELHAASAQRISLLGNPVLAVRD